MKNVMKWGTILIAILNIILLIGCNDENQVCQDELNKWMKVSQTTNETKLRTFNSNLDIAIKADKNSIEGSLDSDSQLETLKTINDQSSRELEVTQEYFQKFKAIMVVICDIQDKMSNKKIWKNLSTTEKNRLSRRLDDAYQSLLNIQ